MTKPDQVSPDGKIGQSRDPRIPQGLAVRLPLAPLAVVLLVTVILQVLVPPVDPSLDASDVFRSSEPSTAWMYKWDSLARTLWTVSSGILILGSIASIYMWGLVVDAFKRRLTRPYWFGTGVVFLVMGCLAWYICRRFIPRSGVGSNDSVQLLWPLIKVSERIPLGSAEFSITIIGIVGMSFLICSAYALQAATDRPDRGTLADTGDRLQWLERMLYVAAFLTIGATLNVRALAWWQASLISKEETAEAYVRFGSAFATSIGIWYTFVVTAVYGSVAIPLWKKARTHVHPICLNALEVEEALRKYGITYSFTQHVTHFAACMGPALVGPVADLLK